MIMTIAKIHIMTVIAVMGLSKVEIQSLDNFLQCGVGLFKVSRYLFSINCHSWESGGKGVYYASLSFSVCFCLWVVATLLITQRSGKG